VAKLHLSGIRKHSLSFNYTHFLLLDKREGREKLPADG
jgi:hypothetical protein